MGPDVQRCLRAGDAELVLWGSNGWYFAGLESR